MEKNVNPAPAETNCPCCENHCPVDQLHCRRGMAHFGKIKDTVGWEKKPETPEEEVLQLLRKCGHYLHHSAGRGDEAKPIALPDSLTDADKATLIELLKKTLHGWQPNA